MYRSSPTASWGVARGRYPVSSQSANSAQAARALSTAARSRSGSPPLEAACSRELGEPGIGGGRGTDLLDHGLHLPPGRGQVLVQAHLEAGPVAGKRLVEGLETGCDVGPGLRSFLRHHVEVITDALERAVDVVDVVFPLAPLMVRDPAVHPCREHLGCDGLVLLWMVEMGSQFGVSNPNQVRAGGLAVRREVVPQMVPSRDPDPGGVNRRQVRPLVGELV